MLYFLSTILNILKGVTYLQHKKVHLFVSSEIEFSNASSDLTDGISASTESPIFNDIIFTISWILNFSIIWFVSVANIIGLFAALLFHDDKALVVNVERKLVMFHVSVKSHGGCFVDKEEEGNGLDNFHFFNLLDYYN